ncbi:MAG: hypothetical protein LBS60_06430 [Deltaproteobacteria bacterium]|jgi:HPt (histidine-containing phosphotransfer) domain-containing protein|nr:hypothetical protein [Deltaproteobacteria bacterium]
MENTTTIHEASWLNIAEGVKRVGGSQKRYLLVLAAFLKDLDSSWPISAAELDLASLPNWTTMAHGLKTALRNIGCDSLANEALALEEFGRAGDLANFKGQLPLFRKNLADLKTQVQTLTKNAAADAALGAQEVDPMAVKALNRLKAGLLSKSLDDIDAALAALQDLSLPLSARKSINDIADYVLTADFSSAERIACDLLKGSIK